LQAKRALFSGKSRRFEPKTLSRPLEKGGLRASISFRETSNFKALQRFFLLTPMPTVFVYRASPRGGDALGFPASEGHDGRLLATKIP
jgi:hypothetical protein